MAPTRKPAARAALERPYQRDNERSVNRAMERGVMPGAGLAAGKMLPHLLRWYSDGWDEEVPSALHIVEGYKAHKPHDDRRGPCVCQHQGQPHDGMGCCHLADGVPVHAARGYDPVPVDGTGSRLGTRAHTDPFRRYLEMLSSETDQDDYYLRPMHAALARLSHRWPLTARILFMVAQSGYDWRGVATRQHRTEEEFCLYLERALESLWHEYRDHRVRLS